MTSSSAASLAAIEEAVARLGPAGLRRAATEAHRLSVESPEVLGGARLDPLPVVLADEQWRALRAGLRQRARLFEAIVQDLYGPRSLLRTGSSLPVLELLSDARYLRGAVAAGGAASLQPLAVTSRVVRQADGSWAVLEDAADVPIGVASALTVRRLLSRTAPELYRTTPVRRLLPYADRLRAAVHAPVGLPTGRPAGPSDDAPDASRTVILVEGDHTMAPSDAREAAEHRMLAGMLGAPVVTAADLRLDADGVRTASLGGPETRPPGTHELVDHIVRLVPAAKLDPLDLGPTPLGGVTGLMEAARQDLVRITNPLGSGILENAALRRVLPDLCRQLLHEDLLLPAISRRELTDPRGLYAWPALTPGPVGGAAGVAVGRRPAVLQMVTTGGPHGYDVMPGGVALALTEQSERSAVASTAADSLWGVRDASRMLKDVWVLGADTDTGTNTNVLPAIGTAAAAAALSLGSGRHGAGPRARTAGGLTLPASMGADLLWLGRNLERTDSSARLLRTLADMAIDLEAESDAVSTVVAQRLLLALPASARPSSDADDPAPRRLDAAIRRALTPGTPASTLPAAVDGVDRTIQSLGDVLSPMVWPPLARMHEQLEDIAARQRAQHVHAHLEQPLTQILDSALSLQAAIGETMPRRYGWFLYDVGRRVERMRSVLLLLRAAFDEDAQLSEPARVRLAGVAAIITETDAAYRRAYHRRLDPHLLVGMLLRDQTLPRSLGFQLPLLGVSLAQLLPGQDGEAARSGFDALMGISSTWEGTADAGGNSEVALAHLDRIAAEVEQAVRRGQSITRSWRLEDV